MDLELQDVDADAWFAGRLRHDERPRLHLIMGDSVAHDAPFRANDLDDRLLSLATCGATSPTAPFKQPGPLLTFHSHLTTPHRQRRPARPSGKSPGPRAGPPLGGRRLCRPNRQLYWAGQNWRLYGTGPQQRSRALPQRRKEATTTRSSRTKARRDDQPVLLFSVPAQICPWAL